MSRRTIVTTALLAVYVAVAVKVIVSLGGVPASRETLIVLILGGIAAASLTSARRLRHSPSASSSTGCRSRSCSRSTT